LFTLLSSSARSQYVLKASTLGMYLFILCFTENELLYVACCEPKFVGCFGKHHM